MKIVYCLPQLYKPGGIERIVTIKANYMAEVYGYDVTLVVANQKAKQPFCALSPKIRLVDLALDYEKNQSSLLKYIYKRHILHKLHKEKLSSFLFEFKPDITISTLTHEAEFLPSIKDGSKKVLEFHFCRGHKILMANAFHFGFVKKCMYYFKCWQEENLIIPKYDKFVVLTEEDLHSWSEKISNVSYIPNIIPFDDEEHAKLDNKIVIAVGRLDAQKGFDRLIKNWRNINKEYPEWKLNIYGDGVDRMMLQSMINTYNLNNCVTLHKPNSNIKERYLESSIFVMTSLYEGLPMTLLEATGLGIPAICYDFPCGPSDVIENNKNGFIVKDKDDFFKCMKKLIDNSDLRKSMGNTAKKMSKRYSRDTIMEMWNNLFKDLCSS